MKRRSYKTELRVLQAKHDALQNQHTWLVQALRAAGKPILRRLLQQVRSAPIPERLHVPASDYLALQAYLDSHARMDGHSPTYGDFVALSIKGVPVVRT